MSNLPAPPRRTRLLPLLAVLFIAELAWILAIQTRGGAYTDGIIQLLALKVKAGLYPPLYGLLSAIVPVYGGHIVSALACLATFFLCNHLGKKLGGYTAGIIAAAAFALSPLVWRWGGQIMSDALYMAISTAALVLLSESWLAIRTSGRPRAARLLAAAVAMAALATLTRYQGVLLAPLLVLIFFTYLRKFRQLPWLALAAGLLWLLVPVWMWYNGFVHESQFASRASLTWQAGLLAWLNTAESFVLISPYYFGYPIAAAALVGVAVARQATAPWYARPAAVLWGLYGIMLLALQAKFGSFQYRYMMPLLPMVVALAGCGAAWLLRRYSHRPALLRWALIISALWLTFFGAAILHLQATPFYDQYLAAQIIKEQAPPAAPIYTNERYGSFKQLAGIKMSYWSGRPVHFLDPATALPAGAIVALSTAYGGPDAVRGLYQDLSSAYSLQPIIAAPIKSTIVPLMDDVMLNPALNQNAMGWVMRYAPQTFETHLFMVNPTAGATPQ